MNRRKLLILVMSFTAALLTRAVAASSTAGEIVLEAGDATLTRGSARYDASLDVIRDWRAADTVASWRFELPAKKTFNVILVYSCPATSAGSEAVVTVADQRVAHIVTASPDANTHKERNIGPIILRKPGTQELRIQMPDKKGLHGAWNLRAVRLVPEN